MYLIIQASATHRVDVPQPMEGSFSIVEITPLAVPERHSFKPIDQMHH